MDVNKNPEPYNQRPVTLTGIVERIRRYTKDRPELNRLIANVESSDEDIMMALDQCFSDFTSTPPPLGRYDFGRPPPIHLLLKGTVIFLLESKGLLESRNSLPFSDGGLSVPNSRTSENQSWLDRFVNSYETAKLNFKKSANIEGAWGNSLSSEYVIVNTNQFYNCLYGPIL